MSTWLKRIARFFLYPLLRYFEPRFEGVISRLDKLQQRMDEFEERVAADVQTSAELLLTFSRLIPTGTSASFDLPATGLHTEPVHREAEAAVEIPYALAALALLPRDAVVCEAGYTSTSLAIPLASLGMQVLTLNPAALGLRHPRVTHIPKRLERWAGPDRKIDGIFCISSLEHLGMSEGQESKDLDLRTLGLFRSWLSPGGTLVLTVPYGTPAVNRHYRIYDAEHLDRLLTGWEILDQEIFLRSGDGYWQLLTYEQAAWELGSYGVATLRARPAE